MLLHFSSHWLPLTLTEGRNPAQAIVEFVRKLGANNKMQRSNKIFSIHRSECSAASGPKRCSVAAGTMPALAGSSPDRSGTTCDWKEYPSGSEFRTLCRFAGLPDAPNCATGAIAREVVIRACIGDWSEQLFSLVVSDTLKVPLWSPVETLNFLSAPLSQNP